MRRPGGIVPSTSSLLPRSLFRGLLGDCRSLAALYCFILNDAMALSRPSLMKCRARRNGTVELGRLGGGEVYLSRGFATEKLA